MIDRQFITNVHDRDRCATKVLRYMREAHSKPGRLALVLAGTKVSDIEGISAAGADAASRRLTPAIDAEALLHGQPLSAHSLPRSPQGVVSPVVISRAMAKLLGLPLRAYDCGCFVSPQSKTCVLSRRPALSVHTGEALPLAVVRRLFLRGREEGERAARESAFIILGECVPGGTTTAMALLSALGFACEDMIGSSLPDGERTRRRALVRQGIRAMRLNAVSCDTDPLAIVAAVGDPMQAFAAGYALSAARHVPVMLAGGSQMLAVYALAGKFDDAISNTIVATTKWVAFDKHAQIAKLACALDAPMIAACADFNQSRHEGLRLYEHGNVKEGVAAGALMAAAYLHGHKPDAIIEAIDRSYDLMVN